MIKFVTDSTACVSKEYAKLHDIKVISLNTTIDDYSIEEGFSDNWDGFYKELKNSKNFPKTSQPTPAEFENAFSEIFKKDPEAKIICLTISESLSGTSNSARIAAGSFPSDKVFVIDSGQTSQSQLLFLEELVSLANEGKSISELLELSEIIKQNVNITFVPETIEYLKRGGRINLVKATIVNLLNIKPILSFTAGVLSNTKKGIGMQKAIAKVLADLPKNIKKIYVCYVYESVWVKSLIEKVNAQLNLNIVEAHKISPVVGSHVGIGAVGVAYIKHYA